MVAVTRINEETVTVPCTGGCMKVYEVPLTKDQERKILLGEFVQNVVEPQWRELLISGTCDACWGRIFTDA